MGWWGGVSFHNSTSSTVTKNPSIKFVGNVSPLILVSTSSKPLRIRIDLPVYASLHFFLGTVPPQPTDRLTPLVLYHCALLRAPLPASSQLNSFLFFCIKVETCLLPWMLAWISSSMPPSSSNDSRDYMNGYQLAGSNTDESPVSRIHLRRSRMVCSMVQIEAIFLCCMGISHMLQTLIHFTVDQRAICCGSSRH